LKFILDYVLRYNLQIQHARSIDEVLEY